MKITYLAIFLLVSFSLSAQLESLPNIIVNDRAGEPVDIKQYSQNGKPKLISLWATWCGPCRQELAALDKVKSTWKEKYDLEIVAVSIDIPQMLRNAEVMFDKNGWDFTFLHDNNQELMQALKLRGIPYSILVDGQGDVSSVQMGYYPGYEEQLEQKIAKLSK